MSVCVSVNSSSVSDLEPSREANMLELSYQVCLRFSGKYALHSGGEGGTGKIVVYRAYFMRLLAYPKPLRDQLILELPTLNAFRTREVATVQREHVDLENGDIQVLDSKKLVFFTVPLDYTVARHFEEFFIETRVRSGLVFTPTQRAGRRRDGHLTDEAIEYIWKKWCKLAAIPYMPPRYGRAYFAVVWDKVQRKSLIDLMDILRHTDPKVTLKYLSKIRDYPSLKAEFHRGTKSPFVSKCARSDSCPLAKEGCDCRMFTPKVEVDAK